MEAEAHREGPKAVTELAAFDAHFHLAGELLSLRKARGLTQQQLSQKTGIQQSEISRIEAGLDRDRDGRTLQEVAELRVGVHPEPGEPGNGRFASTGKGRVVAQKQ